MTLQQRFDTWYSTALGRGFDLDGAWGRQCFDLYNDYAQYIFGKPYREVVPMVLYAYQIFDSADPALYTKVLNTPDGIPPKGAVIIFKKAINGYAGHVAIDRGGSTATKVNVIQQDGGTVTYTASGSVLNPGAPASNATFDYTHVHGWLIPKTTEEIFSYQRIAAAPTFFREAPSTTSAKVQENGADKLTVAGNTYDFKGYVRAESVEGNNVWFVGRYSGKYLYSGGFVDSSTSGLQDLTSVLATPPPVVVAPAPTTPSYVDFVADVPCVTNVNPAHYDNYQDGNFSANQTDVVIHDFGGIGKDTYLSTVNTFRNGTSGVSSHFVVSGNVITQMVSLKNRAFHAGSGGNNFVGIEVDPAFDAATVASVRRLLSDLKAKYGVQLKLHKHTEFMVTLCGDNIDLSSLDISPAVPIPVVLTPPVVVPPMTTPQPLQETFWQKVVRILKELLNIAERNV